MTTPSGTPDRDPLAPVSLTQEQMRHRLNLIRTDIRQASRQAMSPTLRLIAKRHSPRLLAMADGLLNLADEYEQKSAALTEHVHTGPADDATTAVRATLASGWSEAAAKIRSVVAAALSGEEVPS